MRAAMRWGLWWAFAMSLMGCYDLELDSKRFVCEVNSDCARGTVCKSVGGDLKVCLPPDQTLMLFDVPSGETTEPTDTANSDLKDSGTPGPGADVPAPELALDAPQAPDVADVVDIAVPSDDGAVVLSDIEDATDAPEVAPADVCPGSCTPGEKKCVDNVDLSTCVESPEGCPSPKVTTCTAPDAECIAPACVEGACVIMVTADRCWIDGFCYKAGDVRKDKPCQVCAPSNPKAWTNTKGTACQTDKCVTGGTCDAGECTSETKIPCNDQNDCTTDGCDPLTGCKYTAVGTGVGCTDGNVCTKGDQCNGTQCEGVLDTCDDGKKCTTDDCSNPGGCTNTPNQLSCDDGSKCTENDTCTGGTCLGKGKTCNDSNTCTSDSCDDALGCAFTASTGGESCDDGDKCTELDTCNDSKQCAGVTKDCGDTFECTTDTCDPASGCKHAPVDSKCDDGNVCTSDVCSGDAGCVSTKLSGTACVHVDPCVEADACLDGVCSGTPKVCTPLQCRYCMKEYSQIDGRCLRAHKTSAPLSYASIVLGGAPDGDNCPGQPGQVRVASVFSTAQNTFIEQLRASACGTGGAWMGMATSGTGWAWTDGKAMSYVNWDGGTTPPVTAGAHGAMTAGGTWVSLDSTSTLSCIVCEATAFPVGDCK